MGKMMMTVVAVVMVVLTVMSGGGEGQSSTPSCVSNLVPCGSYVNSNGTPPASCCTPLKEAVDNDLKCLCTVLNDTTVMKAFNISTEAGYRLARSCGISNFRDCSNEQGKSTEAGKRKGKNEIEVFPFGYLLSWSCSASMICQEPFSLEIAQTGKVTEAIYGARDRSERNRDLLGVRDHGGLSGDAIGADLVQQRGVGSRWRRRRSHRKRTTKTRGKWRPWGAVDVTVKYSPRGVENNTAGFTIA
ncbi:hypothetical protein GW17_00026827 [Ensete ventricosum]|nr:hypothetical protein GW17_00026827 [Ensete ventricosum]